MNTFLSRASFLALGLTLLVGSTNAPSWGQTRVVSSSAPETIRLEVFLRGDSELCEVARQYAQRLGERTRGLEVIFHDVLEDRQQLKRLWDLARESGRDKPVVPAFLCCSQIHYGFTSEQENGADVENLFTADVYTRSSCPRCQSAKRFIDSTLQPRWPALRFRTYEITYDTAARQRYEELCRSQGKVPGLPTLHFAGQVIIGYQGDHITGAQWTSLIERAAAVREPSSR
jgi:hypothetical protein